MRSVSAMRRQKKGPTFAVWSAEEVKTRHEGKLPAPQTMSVTGSEWSERLQYGVGSSFCRSLSTSLFDEVEMTTPRAEIGGVRYLETDHTLTLESSLPDTSAALSCVKRRTFTCR